MLWVHVSMMYTYLMLFGKVSADKKLPDPQAALARGLPSVHSSISVESTFPYVLVLMIPAHYRLSAGPSCAISSFLHVSTLFIALKFSTLESHFRSGKRSRATSTDENLFLQNLSKVQSHNLVEAHCYGIGRTGQQFPSPTYPVAM